MSLNSTIVKKLKSLTEFLDGLTHKKLVVGALGLGVAVGGATTASAAPFLDDFSSDTSAQYTHEDSYMSGGSFTISGGTLNLSTGSSNTSTVTRTAALPFAVGELFGVDVPVDSGPEGVFQVLASAAAQPNSGTDGYRVRRTGGTVSVDGTSVSTGDPNPAGPLTLWIGRNPGDEFEFYTQTPGGSLVSYGTHTLVLGASLHIGMQAFDTSADTFAFDNLRIVPEPSTAALALLSGVPVVGLRRRRRT